MGQQTVETIGGGNEKIQWTAEVTAIEQTFEVVRKWLEYGAAHHLSSLACWRITFLFLPCFLYLLLRWGGEAATKKSPEEKKKRLECCK